MLSTFETILSAIPKASRLYSSAAKTQRNVKRITPVRVRNQKVPTRQDRDEERMKESMEDFRKEFKKEIETYGDVYDEPNFTGLATRYDKYYEEKGRMKDHIKINKMNRKHFKDVRPREVSLLTWAEKENIRYLTETEPEQWTPEAIAQAYPISPDGVDKLLKSKMKLRRAVEIKNHDERIAQRIQDIKAGKVPITEELEKRLEIRDLIPLKIGDLGINADEIIISMEPKVLGEFGKLVALPQIEKDVESKSQSDGVIGYITDGDYYQENTTEDKLKPLLTNNELKKIFPVQKRMTFGEFETKMKEKDAEKLAADMKYMLNLNNQNPTPIQVSLGESEVQLPDASESSFPSNIDKYKTPDETGAVVVKVEGGQGYLYHPETGYEKPYESTSPRIKQRIEIPEKEWKSGATYKVGDCYYDDTGEFLYRVP